MQNLDKTHITCNLRPCRSKSEVKLKTYNTRSDRYEPYEQGPNQTDNGKRKQRENHLNPKVKIKRFPIEKKSKNKLIKTSSKCNLQRYSPTNALNQNTPEQSIKELELSPTNSTKSYANMSQLKLIVQRVITDNDEQENESKNFNVGYDNIIKNNTTTPITKNRNQLSLKSNKQISKTNVNDVNADDFVEYKVKLRNPTHSIKKKLRINIKRLQIEDGTKTQTEKQTTPIKKSNKFSKKMRLPDNLNACELRQALVFPQKLKTCHEREDLLKQMEEDNVMHSFCERSFIMDRTVCSDFSDAQTVSDTDIVVIKPKIQTDTCQEVKNMFKFHDIPAMVHKQPFYGDYLDVTKKKEVGQTLLCIPGISLNDVEDFKSSMSSLESFSNYRRKMVQTMKCQLRNDAAIKEYLSNDKIVFATPYKLPPSKQDSKIWLQAKERFHKKNFDADKNIIIEDSPIEFHDQKADIFINTGNCGALEDTYSSMCSIKLTPLTTFENNQTETGTTTALTSVNGTVKGDIKRRISSEKLDLPNDLEKCTKDNSEDNVVINQKNIQFDETVPSETDHADLEKVSFLSNLVNSQGSFDSSFGISHATLNNTFGFKINLENLQQAKSDIEYNHLTTLSLEVFVSTREDLLPNPQFDAISCILYAVENSIPTSGISEGLPKTRGLIIVSDGNSLISSNLNYMDSGLQIKEVANEIEGLLQLIDVCAYWDPDIFVGYEIEMSSWGYVMERAKFLDFNIAPLLSRVPTQNVRDFIDEEQEKLTDLDVETKLCGRILLDVWRLMRSEIALTSYTFENVMYHILHRRCPLHTYKDLTKWFRSPQTRWIVLEYYLERVRGTLELLDQLDLIGRTSEMAKLIGIQFYEVLSRGSQYRVESMMLRIAKPKNLVPLSPSIQQRAHMRAPEYLPLILEPQSRFYADPVIVLDFQSLYPSMIMAYNYCFSTCLGRIEHLGQSTPFEFGASQLRISPKLLRKLLKNDMITISPCGIAFIKKEIREGVLPRMLNEILDTRQMVKQSMKLHKNNTALQRILHSRQLGLKLIANVTYGYTAANFSGRMPCVEVGDSVVAKGRETLERAIKLVEANEEWNVKVVYGDTDSMFVLVPGRSKTEAFKIGSEIAELVTKDNPQPVKIKLEKVYQPCILQTKKRYVGYMFESPEQKEPIFEAKGIETVRRDGCPAAVKMLEKTLRILFDTSDVSQVKKYICRQFTKLLSGKANIQDLVFAKEFRGLKGYKPTACVPALELARKWIQLDPRKIPRSGERVQFIITNGPPGVPLIKLVRSPHDVLADEGLKINAIYYITKAIIPPLNRCLLLIGADVNEWFASLPRKILFNTALSSASEVVSSNGIKKSTISQYFSSTKCIVDCGRQTKQTICSVCLLDRSNSLVILEEKISKLQRGYFLTQFICQSCCGRSNNTICSSFDCPVLYVLEMKKRELTNINQIRNITNDWL